MFRILVAEDDTELSGLFRHVLTKNGFNTVCVSNGREALQELENEFYDLLISDIMMPEVDGYELVQSLRLAGITTPVLMVTAKNQFDDMRLGFLSGSDDYMVKPVNVNELVLRVNALLRRAQMIHDCRQAIGDTVLEYDAMTVSYDGKTVRVPQKEFMLLYKMCSYPGKIFTRQQLLDDIWGYDSKGDAHSMEVHISRLRDRFRDNRDFEIMTIRSVGYKVIRK